MKKVSIILMTIIVSYGTFMVSCSGNSAAEEQKNQKETFVADSLENIRLDSLALIAWGQAMFGMSIKEVLATETFKGSKCYRNSVEMSSESRKAYSEAFNLKHGLFNIEADFQDGELYEIFIASHWYEWSELNDLINDCNFFVDQFSTNYIKPVSLKKNVSSRNFTSGKEFVYAKFVIKDKTIFIQMGEDFDSRQPYYCIYIKNSSFPKKAHVETSEEKKQREQKEKNAQFSEDNSF